MGDAGPRIKNHTPVQGGDTHSMLAADATDPIASPQSASAKPPRWHHRKGVWLVLVVWLLLVGGIITAGAVHYHRQSLDQLSAGLPPSGSPCKVNGTLVPLHTPVSDGYFDIELLQAIYNPPGASPPAPAPDREYLEADFAITTTPNTVHNTAIQMVYEPSIVPPGYLPCGVYDYPIDSAIPGKQDISSSDFQTADLTPLAPGTTVNAYALFSIPIGDKYGQLVWFGDGGSKTYIFELH